MGLFGRKAHWHVHICTMTPDQQPYYAAMEGWLRQQGYTILTANDDAPEAKRDAARACDLCLMLLGPSASADYAGTSFSQTEIEVSAAQDVTPGKVLIFAQAASEQPTTPEHAEFITRQRGFAGGSFQATCVTPADLVAQLAVAVRDWGQAQRAARLPAGRAVMISSTGDLLAERAAVRAAVRQRRLPLIDYQIAASAAVAPIAQVTAWARDCRALIVILGQRYGYVSPVDGLGVTELEFVTALAAGRPILACLRPDAFTTDDVDQQQFVARVRQFVPPAQCLQFTDAADLQRQVRAALRHVARWPRNPLPTLAPETSHAWYRRHLARWLGPLPIPGRVESLPLRDMILSLATVPIDPTQTPPRDIFTSIFIPDNPSDLPTIAPEEALAQSARVLIVGGAGTGKTTILRWYALQASAQMVPLFIDLARYAADLAMQPDLTLPDFIAAEEQRLVLALAPGQSRWRAALEAGQGLLLLDSLDRVPAAQLAAVQREILSCVARLPLATRIVVAGRIPDATLLSTGFTRYDVPPLTQGQQQILARAWLQVMHPTADDQQIRRRLRRVLFQLRVSRDETDWARTPQLLGIFTLVADAMFVEDVSPVAAPLAAEAVYRRALRVLLTQGSAPTHLLLRETLLQQLAGQEDATTTPPPVTAEAFARAWNAVPQSLTRESDLATIAAALNNVNGLLIRQENVSIWLDPSFWFAYLARSLAAQPEPARLDLIVRRRLAEHWARGTMALVAELDRQGRHDEATHVVAALVHADGAPIFGAPVSDPLHVALLKAAYAQGSRPEPWRRAEPGPTIARLWREAWLGKGYAMDRYAVWSLYILGPAAAPALDILITTAQPTEGPQQTITRDAQYALERLAFDGNVEAKRILTQIDATTPALGDSINALDAPLERLRQGLSSEKPFDQGSAALQLRKFGRLAADCVPQLIALLEHGDDFVRSQAAAALHSMGSAAAPAAEALAGDMFAQGEAAGTLRMLGVAAAPAVPIVTAALHDADVRHRKDALVAVRALGPLLRPALPAIIDLIEIEETAQYSANATLRAVGGDITPLLDFVRARLHDPDERTQRNALYLAANLGDLSAPLIDDLRAIAERPTPDLRVPALFALGNLGAAGVPALPTLQEALGVTWLQQSALRAIGAIGPAASLLLPVVLPFLHASESTTRQAALEAVQHLNPPATPDLLAPVVTLLAQEHQFERMLAFTTACALRPLTPAIARALVIAYAQQSDPQFNVNYYSDFIQAYQQIVDAGMPSGTS